MWANKPATLYYLVKPWLEEFTSPFLIVSAGKLTLKIVIPPCDGRNQRSEAVVPSSQKKATPPSAHSETKLIDESKV